MTDLDEATLTLLDMSLDDEPPCEVHWHDAQLNKFGPCEDPADFLAKARCCGRSMYICEPCVEAHEIAIENCRLRGNGFVCNICEASLITGFRDNFLLVPVRPA